MDEMQKRNIDLPAEWLSVDIDALKEAVSRRYQKLGLFAQMPLVCKGSDCPYNSLCYEWQQGEVSVGDRCLPEMSSIFTYTTQYCQTLNITPDNFIDMTLIKDLVNVDLVIDRCNKILALTNLVEDVAVTAVKNSIIYKPEINRAQEILERMIARKEKLLQLLNATRKDQAKTGSEKPVDISLIISQTREELDSRGE